MRKMELKLEDLAYQREAIEAVVRLFEGQPCQRRVENGVKPPE